MPVFTLRTYSQSNWRNYIEQLAEESEMDQESIENMYQDLLYLENNPMDLNSLSLTDLENFPLISSEQANSIFEFLNLNRPIVTIYEIRNVPKLDYNTVSMILPFFKADSSKEYTYSNEKADSLSKGISELMIRTDKTLTHRAGYSQFSDSILAKYPNRKYRGEDFYNSLKFSYRSKDKIQLGLTAEKDAGEPFLESNNTKGYDYYGFYVQANNISKIKTLIVGDYRLSFGQGLILNNDYLINKAWSVNNLAKRTQQPKRHFSLSESGFFRGVAVQIALGNVTISPFYSISKIDANISNDGSITSLKTDGLHRTLLEISKKRNTREQVIGTNINYKKEKFQIGISGLYHNYNREFDPSPRKYNAYYFRGDNNYNFSTDYSYQLPGFIIAGETAIDKNGTIATINLAQYRPSSSSSFSILHRYYPISYNALHAKSFSEGSRIQNEHGLFLSATFSPIKRTTITTYMDLVKFPWLKFAVDKPSKALDCYILMTYNISRDSFFEARFKYKLKEKNSDITNNSERLVIPYDTKKLRLRYSNTLPSGWGFRTTVDIANYAEKNLPNEYGYMISQNINYKNDKPFSGDLFLSWFDAKSYSTRLYSYERNLLNTFYMPSFYGKGIRLALSSKLNISKSLSFSAKLGYSRFFNRDTIGSGTELIDGNSRTDIFTYLRWRFGA